MYRALFFVSSFFLCFFCYLIAQNTIKIKELSKTQTIHKKDSLSLLKFLKNKPETHLIKKWILSTKDHGKLKEYFVSYHQTLSHDQYFFHVLKHLFSIGIFYPSKIHLFKKNKKIDAFLEGKWVLPSKN